MADPLTFALTRPELAARLVSFQRNRMPEAGVDAAYKQFFESVPIDARSDAHEFAILTRMPVVWTQADSIDEPEEGVIGAPGFVRCWLEGREGWRILGASGPVQTPEVDGRARRLEVRLDVAAPNGAFGFPVMAIIDGEYDMAKAATASAEYLKEHGLWEEQVPRTFLVALFLFLAPQLEQVVGWFQNPSQNLRFGKPRRVRAFEAVGLEVLDYPVAPAKPV
ncbi:hypothetical protein [Derxia gummosa]|uniref:Uncharacterized protein n=1 Tax=Derxia gummosa DSM 723 TaxID=1121388 RepID=A0A8B6X562_9BURK|nr:hypothetical protein [Derxia gummosa]